MELKTLLEDFHDKGMGEFVRETFLGFTGGIIDLISRVMFTVVAIVGGWLFASMIGRIVSRLIDVLRINAGLRKAGIDALFVKSGNTLRTGSFVGALVTSFIFIIFLILISDVLDLPSVGMYLQRALVVLGKVIVSVFILIGGAIISGFVLGLVTKALLIVGERMAYLIAQVAKWMVLVLTMIIAIEHLDVVYGFTQLLLVSVIAMGVLAGALTFWVNIRDVIAKYIKRYKERNAYTSEESENMKR